MKLANKIPALKFKISCSALGGHSQHSDEVYYCNYIVSFSISGLCLKFNEFIVISVTVYISGCDLVDDLSTNAIKVIYCTSVLKEQ